MSTTVMPPAKKKDADVSVGMGQIALISPPTVGRAIVGSCIALTLYDARLRIGTMAHIVLAEQAGRPGTPGKFADTALPHMLDLLAKEGAPASRLNAKLAGGASMFQGGGPIRVGDANREAVKELLGRHKIRIAGEHVGGNKGRRITFEVETGTLKVEVVGEATVVL